MKSKIPPIVNRLINKFGYTLVKQSKKKETKLPDGKAEVSAQGMIVKDPIHHNTQERVNEFYSSDEIFEQYLAPGRLASYTHLIDTILKNGITFENKSVVDVGCGTGHILLEIQTRFPSTTLTGTEYSSEALKRARDLCPQVHFESQDICEAWPNQYDIVICNEVIEHLLHPNQAIQTLVSMVKPNGHLIITVPNGRIDNFLGHINFWSPESWNIFIADSISENFTHTTSTIRENIINMAIVHRKY